MRLESEDPEGVNKGAAKILYLNANIKSIVQDNNILLTNYFYLKLGAIF